MIKFQITNSKSQNFLLPIGEKKKMRGIVSYLAPSPFPRKGALPQRGFTPSPQMGEGRCLNLRLIVGICVLFVICNLEFGILISNVSADTVYLASGEKLKGLVVEEHHDRIIFSTYQGEIQIPRVSIDQIFFDSEEQNYVYLGDDALKQENLDLALGFYQKAYQINPDLEKTGWAFLRLVDAKNRKRFNIQPQEAIVKLTRQLGVSVDRFQDKIRVISVAVKSPAERAGISTGDYITGVWDSSLMYMDAQAAAEVLVGAPHTPVKLTIEKNIILPVNNTFWFRNIFYIAQFINFGVRLSLAPSGLIVAYVRPGGQCQKSGLKVLDEIVSVNQEPTRYMPISSIRKKIFQSKLKEMLLVIRRQAILTRGE
jgi:membrane-associated protease RseP (regulator of RpoE activity)